MFREPLRVKKNTNMRKSDTKKLLQRLSEEAVAVLPKKMLVADVKILAFNAKIINVYMVDREPMFFDFYASGFLFPTLYFTWISPVTFPMFVVHDTVLQYLQNGADLMLQEVIRKGIPLANFPRDAPVTISILNDDHVMGPMVVGRALMSSEEMIANKFEGKGVEVLHIFKDALWTIIRIPNWLQDTISTGSGKDNLKIFREFGSRVCPSQHSLNYLFKSTDKDEPSKEEKPSPSVLGEHYSSYDNKMLDDISVKDITSLEDSMEALFYYNCLLKCVPIARKLDMKRTKYKKFSAFLNEVNKSEDGPLVEIRNKGKGCDMIVKVFERHPALRSFIVSDEIVHDKEHTSITCGPNIHEFYSISDAVLPILRCCGNYTKGQLLAVPEFCEIVRAYVKREVCLFMFACHLEKLQKLRSRGGIVRLDPILANVTKISGEVTHWNTLFHKIQSEMTKTFVLRMPDGRELVRKINMPKIIFEVKIRSGNKKDGKKGKRKKRRVTLISNLAFFGLEVETGKLCQQIQMKIRSGNKKKRQKRRNKKIKKVTLVSNLAVFGIETKKLCQKIQVEAATSATTKNKAANCEGPQILVLGNQVTYLGGLLQKEYGIDKKYIDGLKLGIKRKQKSNKKIGPECLSISVREKKARIL